MRNHAVSNPLDPSRRLRVVDSKHTCKICDIRRVMTAGDDSGGLADAAYSARCHGPYRPGDYIYRVGDPMNYVYAVTSGTVKSEVATGGGDLQVTGFYLHGELFGVDALGQAKHVDDAIAVERSWVCALPVNELEKVCQSSAEALRELLRLISGRSHHAVTNLFATRGLTTEQRVYNFLHDLESRYRDRRHWGGEAIELTMSKEDIANYLAITPETLSRTLRKLQDADLVINHRKAFVLLEPWQDLRDALA